MSSFIKGQGAKIGIKFTDELKGDVSGNVGAFTITGKQRKHINGELIDGDYQIDKIEKHLEIENAILITFKVFNRFPTVEGSITISYDASKGNLTGAGGAVESFTKTFTPKDLIPEPNPHIEEYISVAPSIEIDFITIDYVGRYVEEYISASPEIEIEFKDITIVNP